MKVYEGFPILGILVGILRKIIRVFIGFSMNDINHPFSGPIYGGTTVMDLKKSMVRPGAGHFGWGLLKEQRNRGRWFQDVHTKHHTASSLGF